MAKTRGVDHTDSPVCPALAIRAPVAERNAGVDPPGRNAHEPPGVASGGSMPSRASASLLLFGLLCGCMAPTGVRDPGSGGTLDPTGGDWFTPGALAQFNGSFSKATATT